jgi:mannose-6-phosphate isomerase
MSLPESRILEGDVHGPQLLPANQPDHFYRGGRRIAALRGGPVTEGMRRPEEWLASTTTMASSDVRGLSHLADGTLLRDAVRAEPEHWLGAAHVRRYGASTEILVKLLDAGQRLPVHLHPDRAFAQAHLSAAHGKTEAWYVLAADEGARVRLGFTAAMSAGRVRELVAARDTDALLAALHPIEVGPGDAVLVPAGLPHSIDAGMFLLELQEPTDFSILLEARGQALDLDRDGHLGLGFDTALRALHLGAVEPEALAELVHRADPAEPSLLPAAADPFFRAHRSGPATPVEADQAGPVRPGPIEAGFAVLLVTGGAGRLVAEHAPPLALARGDVAVVPFAAGGWRLEGDPVAVVCRPPAPH